MNLKSIYDTIQLNSSLEGDIVINKEHSTLNEMILMLGLNGISGKGLTGFHYSFTIPHISKEFDLLRFSSTNIINIELKSELNGKEEKIVKQQVQNEYYLKFIKQEVLVFTYVKGRGFFERNRQNDLVEVEIDEVIYTLNNTTPLLVTSLEKYFQPKNYLISPFNRTEKFLNNEYFLSDHQDQIKRKIVRSIDGEGGKVFCISANAGTGKSLLGYDIAKSVYNLGIHVEILHCGILNGGHKVLNQKIGNIRAIKYYKKTLETLSRCDKKKLLVIDEAHRIYTRQLKEIFDNYMDQRYTIICLYDSKQYLHYTEKVEVHKYLSESFPNIDYESLKLSKKIRTNKNMASFIRNFNHIGSSVKDCDYDNVTIEYFSNFEFVPEYLKELEKSHSWTPITFSSSLYNVECHERLSGICKRNAHQIIGQEFEKVTFVLDNNFRYIDRKFNVNKTYYSLEGMVYQILTRVVDELKIIVVGNEELYNDLISIKNLEFLASS